MSGTQYDDPNRESLGLEPIWTGAGDEVNPQVTQQKDEEAPSEEAPSKRPAKK